MNVSAPLSLLFLSLAAAQNAPPPSTTKSTCPPEGSTKPGLLQLKAKRFEIASAEERNRLALSLLPCLESPDPAIRDGVAFEALSTWLRAKALTPATIVTLGDSLRATLTGEKDALGFRLPFAALALSEVARADRIEPVFTESVRAAMVEVAAQSLVKVTDYRGFDPRDGWRHGVAHGADLALQLAVNRNVGAPGVRLLMDAVQSQIAPETAPAYVFGEPERFARAVVFTYRRGVLDAAYWDAWFASLAEPKPFESWNAGATSLQGLAKRHNTVAFLNALSFAGRAAGDEAGKTVAALADKTATRIMGG